MYDEVFSQTICREAIVQKLQHELISKKLNIIAHEIYTLTYIVSYYVHEGCACKSSLD